MTIDELLAKLEVENAYPRHQNEVLRKHAKTALDALTAQEVIDEAFASHMDLLHRVREISVSLGNLCAEADNRLRFVMETTRGGR